jgi:hypothetical protein
MTIFGWLVSVGILSVITFAILFASLFTLSEYNIGGVPNSFWDKFFMIVLLSIVGYGWYYDIFILSPFTIAVK